MDGKKKLRTIDEVRQDFSRKGISIANWAKDNDFSPRDVYDVLNRRTKGAYGISHDIAVLLGIKDGEVCQRRSA